MAAHEEKESPGIERGGRTVVPSLLDAFPDPRRRLMRELLQASRGYRLEKGRIERLRDVQLSYGGSGVRVQYRNDASGRLRTLIYSPRLEAECLGEIHELAPLQIGETRTFFTKRVLWREFIAAIGASALSAEEAVPEETLQPITASFLGRPGASVVIGSLVPDSVADPSSPPNALRTASIRIGSIIWSESSWNEGAVVLALLGAFELDVGREYEIVLLHLGPLTWVGQAVAREQMSNR